jgi:hypothetical protein
MSVFTIVFWKLSLERAIKTAAQAAVLAFMASDATSVNLFDLSVGPVVGFALGGFVLSLLTSVGSAQIGDDSTPSLV